MAFGSRRGPRETQNSVRWPLFQKIGSRKHRSNITECDELVLFSALPKTDFAKRTMRACPLETHTDTGNDDADNNDVTFINESVELRMHRLVVDNHMEFGNCISKY